MEQRSSEWFSARKGRVTGSIVGGLLGLAPYMSKEDAFRALVRSVHGLPDEFKGNIATDYGQNNEDGARVEYELETGNTVSPASFVPFDTWLGASPDGYIDDDGLIEIKCPFGLRKDTRPKFKSIDDQAHYYAQIQIQLYVTHRQWCDFYQWAPGGTKLERVWRDYDWLSENLPVLRGMYDDAVKADADDYDGEKRVVVDTPEAVRLVNEYDELSEAIENATARKKELLAEMVRIGSEKNAIIAGRNLTLVKRSGSVSYAKALAFYAPDADLERFRGKPSEGWVLK